MYRHASSLRVSWFRSRFLACIMIAVIGVSVLPPVSMAQQPTATMTAVTGTVLVNGQALGAGTILGAGDIIETLAGAQVVLQLSDGSVLEVGENTKLDFAELSQTISGVRVSRIKLAWGWVRAKLSPGHQGEGAAFEVETPNALMGFRFSLPQCWVGYDAVTMKTVGLAETAPLEALNTRINKAVFVPVNSTVVVTNTTITVLAGLLSTVSIGGKLIDTGATAGPAAIETAPAPDAGTTAGQAATGGISTTTMVVGAAALVGVGGAIAIASSGKDDSSGAEYRCDDTQVSGETTPETRVIEMGRTSGTFEFSYDMIAVRDRMVVEYEGSPLFDTGCVSGSDTVYLSYSGSSRTITVRVTPNCAGGSYTYWEFAVSCPW